MYFYSEHENRKLLSELEKESQEVARLTAFEAEVQRLKVELDDVQHKLSTTCIELGKTQSKNKTMEKHEHVRIMSPNHFISMYCCDMASRIHW